MKVAEVPWEKWIVCTGNNAEWSDKYSHVLMGYSARTDGWRYNMWLRWNST